MAVKEKDLWTHGRNLQQILREEREERLNSIQVEDSLWACALWVGGACNAGRGRGRALIVIQPIAQDVLQEVS